MLRGLEIDFSNGSWGRFYEQNCVQSRRRERIFWATDGDCFSSVPTLASATLAADDSIDGFCQRVFGLHTEEAAHRIAAQLKRSKIGLYT